MILVTGASGRIGTAVLRELTERAIPVRALARPRSRSPMRDDPAVQWREGDLGDERIVEGALEGVHTIVLHSAPAPTQVAQQERVVDAAVAHGVKRIVKLSAIGAASEAACDVSRWHWRVEQRVTSSGLLAGCQGMGQVAEVDARDVGAVLGALAAAERIERPVENITGPEALDFQAMARVLSQHFGRPIRYVDCTPGDLLQCAQAAGVDSWLAHDMVAWQTEARDGRYAIVHDTVERITRRPPRRFETFANELATSLRYANAPERPKALEGASA